MIPSIIAPRSFDFRAATRKGKPLFSDNTKSFELVADDNSMPGMRMEQTMQWTLPIVYPKDVKGRHGALAAHTFSAYSPDCSPSFRRACCN